MDPSIQAVPGYHVWELPGKPVKVYIQLDVIDRLSNEVMRGFGAVPKRGAEVGGILLGTIEQGSPTIVRIEDFEAVPCDYKRGPSYLFTADDGAAFDDACTRAAPGAVGYFRSHTREGLSMAPEDLALMEHYFPEASQVALLVKPFVTKVSMASFFFREDGLFQSAPLLEFPFRRRELTGEEAPPRRSMMERVPRRPIPPPDPIAPAYVAPPKPPARKGWVWLPLSFVFLLLGVVLGFQAALTMGSRAGGGNDYAMGLRVTKDGDNLSIKWDRDASPVKSAQRGVLEIEDGGTQRSPVELDAAQLRNGALLFTNTSKTVKFRLIVFPQQSVSVMQTLEWKAE
jgi:hypothetical protein